MRHNFLLFCFVCLTDSWFYLGLMMFGGTVWLQLRQKTEDGQDVSFRSFELAADLVPLSDTLIRNKSSPHKVEVSEKCFYSDLTHLPAVRLLLDVRSFLTDPQFTLVFFVLRWTTIKQSGWVDVTWWTYAKINAGISTLNNVFHATKMRKLLCLYWNKTYRTSCDDEDINGKAHIKIHVFRMYG